MAESGDFAALVFTVPAATKRVHPFTIGFFSAGDSDALHPTLFAGIEDVLTSALASNAAVVRRADELDAGWFATAGSRDEKLAHAHAVRKHLVALSVKRSGDRWKLFTPESGRLAAFDAEFFPWARDQQS
jgi:hypothetical protein